MSEVVGSDNPRGKLHTGLTLDKSHRGVEDSQNRPGGGREDTR